MSASGRVRSKSAWPRNGGVEMRQRKFHHGAASEDSLRMYRPLRWSAKGWGGAALLTLLLFVAMPLAHVLNRPDMDQWIVLQDVEVLPLPPPPAPPVFEVPPAPEPVREPVPLELPTPLPPPVQPSPTLEWDAAWAPGAIHAAYGPVDWQVWDGIYDLSDIDAPPRPVVQAPPMYPAAARQAGVEGHVDLRFVVTDTGTVRDIEVLDAQPGRMFVPSAVAAVERWRFEPATHRGEPVAVRVEVPLYFRLER